MMLLGSMLGLALCVLFGLKVAFLPWLVTTAVLQAVTAYILTRHRWIAATFLSAIFAGVGTWLVLPMLTDDGVPVGYDLAVELLKEAPFVLFGISIIVSTVLGIYPISIDTPNDGHASSR